MRPTGMIRHSLSAMTAPMLFCFKLLISPSNYITFGKQSRLKIAEFNENVIIIGTDIDAFLWQRVEGIVYLFYTFVKFQKNTA